MVQTTEDKLFLEQKLESPSQIITEFLIPPQNFGVKSHYGKPKKKSLINIHFMYIIDLQYPHFQISELP